MEDPGSVFFLGEHGFNDFGVKDPFEVPQCGPPFSLGDDTFTDPHQFPHVFPSLDLELGPAAGAQLLPSSPAHEEASLFDGRSASSSPYRVPHSPSPSPPVHAPPQLDELEPDAKRKKSNAGKRKRSKAQGFITKEEIDDLKQKGLPDEVAALADGPMTPAQERLLKKQRRLIKNRESAMLSRQRKKEYVGGLEARASRAEKENTLLRQKVAELQGRNEDLSSEIRRLRDLLNIESPFAGIMSSVQQQSKALSMNGVSGNVKSAGVCLMIMLFSFGMFYNPHGKDTTPALFKREHIEVPEVVMPSSTSERAYVGRVLTSTPSVDATKLQKQEAASPRVFYREPIKSVESRPSKVAEDSKGDDLVKAFHQLRSIMEQEEQRKASQTRGADGASMAVVIHDDDQEAKVAKKEDPDAYVVCAQAQGFLPERNTSLRKGELPVVSLMIPASTLPSDLGGSSDGNGSQGSSNEMLHLSCQLLDMQIVPLGDSNDNSTGAVVV